jgi:ElaB/YqjD/DUF883 family membrane-anchored ribosome-binding protein
MSQEIRIQPETPEAARAEIERTRERISGTLDEIEVAILRKKQRLQEQVDVRARIRERPMEAAGVVLGLGLLIGFLTGGGEKKARENLKAGEEVDRAAERAAIWEARARRLLTIARGQEEEIDELEAALDARAYRYANDVWEDAEWDEEDEEEWEYGPSRLTVLAATLGEGLADLWSRSSDLTRGAASRVQERLRSLD